MAVLAWYGGKHVLAPWIISQFPPHEVYVEPFGGAMAVLLAKPPAVHEVYNDIDSDVVNFWRVLRDPELFPRLQRRLWLTPFAYEEYRECQRTWKEVDDPVERAARWYVAVRQSFSHIGAARNTGWHRQLNAHGGIMSQWYNGLEELPAIHARLRNVQIEHLDWREVLKRYDSANVLFYLDPPYLLETRRGEGYRHELTRQDHEELVQAMLRLRGMAALSCYDHEVYEPLRAAGWRRYQREVSCSAARRTRLTGILGKGATFRRNQRRVETLYVGPPEHLPPTLFDLYGGALNPSEPADGTRARAEQDQQLDLWPVHVQTSTEDE